MTQSLNLYLYVALRHVNYFVLRTYRALRSPGNRGSRLQYRARQVRLGGRFLELVYLG